MQKTLIAMLIASFFSIGASVSIAADGDAVKTGAAKEFGREAESEGKKQKYGREADAKKE